jgi:hypothetical protein
MSEARSEGRTAGDVALSIRLLPDEKALIRKAGDSDGLPASVWARQVLLMVVDGGLDLQRLKRAVAEAQVEPEPAPPPIVLRGANTGLGATVLLPGTCLHPMHLREQYPTFDQCVCGRQFPR